MSKFNVGRSPRNGNYVTASKSNPNRVVGGHKSWATRLSKANKPGDEGLIGSILKLLFGRKK